MSVVRMRVMVARMVESDGWAVVSAIDETIWEHWDDTDDEGWRAEAVNRWGIEADSEFRELFIEVDGAELAKKLEAVTLQGKVAE